MILPSESVVTDISRLISEENVVSNQELETTVSELEEIRALEELEVSKGEESEDLNI